MANTYSKIYLQAIFAVKYRNATITKSFSTELYAYMAGIIKSENQYPIKINGMPDHVHLVFAIKPAMAISDLIRVVKTNSSKWINASKFLNTIFEWQRGYGVFSYSHSQIDWLIKYVTNQESHHKGMSFKEEYLALLHEFNIEFRNVYLFNWIYEK
jgi:putative transposase